MVVEVVEKWLKVVVPFFDQPTKTESTNAKCKMQNYSEIVVGT